MSGVFDTFSCSITGEILEFNPDAIWKPDTLVIRMTRGERRIANELRKEFGAFERVVIDMDGERHEFSADSLIRMLESYEQVPEQGERENGGERESYDAGFSNGMKACLQQLDGLIYEGADVDEIQGWIDRQWEEET